MASSYTITPDQKLRDLLKRSAQDNSRTIPQETMHILRKHFGITASKAPNYRRGEKP